MLRPLQISIHALREEGDGGRTGPSCAVSNFYPRPPRGGRRRCTTATAHRRRFLSTPSARRATDFYYPVFANLGISIHALREEGDVVVGSVEMLNTIFLSTPSARRATICWCADMAHPHISIHALREEGDHIAGEPFNGHAEFLSTPSARRATRLHSSEYRPHRISIHALREEGDSKNRDKISIFKQIIQHSARI